MVMPPQPLMGNDLTIQTNASSQLLEASRRPRDFLLHSHFLFSFPLLIFFNCLLPISSHPFSFLGMLFNPLFSSLLFLFLGVLSPLAAKCFCLRFALFERILMMILLTTMVALMTATIKVPAFLLVASSPSLARALTTLLVCILILWGMRVSLPCRFLLRM